MTKRMLIDATHAEETRVVVLDGNRLEDFDVETSTKRQLKGNIYLAKVVRVEPSLQAAFVEYGGNRHGFLAFSEIHPDYYQIPVADRERLLEMEEEEARREEEQAEAEFAESPVQNGEVAGEAAAEPEPAPESGENGDSDQDDRNLGRTQPLVIEPEVLSGPVEQTVSLEHEPDEHVPGLEPDFSQTPAPELWALPQWPRLTNEQPAETRPAAMEQVQATPVADHDPEEEHARGAELEIVPEAPPPETVGGDHDNGEDQRERRMPPRFLRNYKIQEVIKRRQILLVQVVKEERGTKGAALTTYISLAGRFCVLMPNSPRGGGISRKITSVSDRKRLKDVIAELDLPKGMGLIVRTAGANRPKPEIKRDCEYLLRLWDDIREHTLESIAPALIYEEASLIKRAIRDVYSRDIDEVLVDGDDGWKAARDFMRMLMPAHAKKVQLWRDNGQPLFAKYQVEAQLDGMLLPTVQLRSGGYLVINQAEALVAIDVNSGRSTRERNIEETALRTDLEAADEIARQLRLRDLAGLIVIDFIDMESKKHNSMVERRLKEALKNDRARIQVGHISHFGLLEMSRQRLRPSLAETSFIACPHCGGTGHVRSTESAAIHVLRGIEEEGSKRRAAEITVHVSTPVALYLLNHKRERLREIELRYDMRVVVAGDDTQIAPQFRIERVRAQTQETRQEAQPESAAQAVRPDARPQPKEAAETEQEAGEEEIEDQAEEAAEDPASEDTAADGAEDSADDPERRRRRRRRRRRGQRREEETGAEEQPLVADMPPPLEHAAAEQPAGPVSEAIAETRMEGVPEHGEATDANEDEEDGRGRRRGRRGGKRRRRDGTEAPSPYAEPGAEQPDLPPVYIGPTPANPFGGHAFDIFDVLEQAEQSGGTSSATAEQVIPREAPADDRPLIHAEEAGSPDEGPVQMELAPPAEPPPLPEPSSETWVAELEPVGAHAAEAAEPVSEPAPVEPAPEEPAPAEPAIKPIVIGGEDEPPVAERKRGWWRR